MPPKIDPDSVTERVHLVAPRSLLKRVGEWRRLQDPIPSVSGAIRDLLEIALDAEDARLGKPKRMKVEDGGDE